MYIKYLVVTAIEEDLDVLGIFETENDAQEAVREDFAKAVGVSMEELDSWLEEQEDAGISALEARALDSTTEDGMNHDWKIVPLYCEGECRVATEKDIRDAELTSMVFPPYEPKPVTVEAITGVIKEALVDCDLLTVKAKTAVWVVYHWLTINSIPLSVMSAFEKELSQDPEYDWLSPERTFSIVQYLSAQVLYLLQMASVAEYRDANIPKKAVARAMQKCEIEHDVDTIRDIVALYVTGGEKLLQTERYNCGIGDDFDEWVPIVKRLVAAMTA